MIVNPSYAYMGKAEPANPVIFQKNEYNYPYSGVNYEIAAGGYFRMKAVAELEFSDLNLTNFTKLSVQGGHNYSGTLQMKAIFIDASGNSSPGVTVDYYNGQRTTGVWNIPEQFRAKKCKVKFTTNNSSSLNLYFAKLS